MYRIFVLFIVIILFGNVTCGARLFKIVPNVIQMTPVLFSTIEVSRQVFFRTATTAAIVNLKPIIPGRELGQSLNSSI